MSALSTGEIVQLLILGAFGLYLSSAVVRMFRGRMIAGVLALGFWLMLFAVVLTGYSYRDALGMVAERVAATVVPGLPIDSGAGEVTILRGMDGQFTVKARSGKTRLTLIFDTGASSVVLKAEDAVRLGIDPRHLDFDMEVGTANGRALTAEATLPELSIGNLHQTDVPVLVAKPGALHENLLGMSFLDRLGSYAVERNTLVLRSR